MTKEEREYANLQNRKDALAERIASGTMTIKNKVNSSKAEATSFFDVAGTDGTRDLLMSASGVISCNENHLLAKATPAECVEIYEMVGVMASGGTPAPSSTKLLYLAQLIVIGYQLSALDEAPYDTSSNFNLQPQPDGSVSVLDLEIP